MAILGTVIFLFLAPGTMAGLIPWWICRWRSQDGFAASLPVRMVGGVLIAAGLVVLVDSFARFAVQGLGTPAPPFPTRHMVIGGLYRHVRNPMYLAVVSLIAGQGLIFRSVRVLQWGALFWLCCHLFVVLYEEPTLSRQFGTDYEAFRANVPRWRPRLKPWRTTS